MGERWGRDGEIWGDMGRYGGEMGEIWRDERLCAEDANLGGGKAVSRRVYGEHREREYG